MARNKLSLEYMVNTSARKATFKKRKQGLKKKLNELRVLCGVDACAVLSSPYDAQPEIWPSATEAQRVVSEFRNMPDMERGRKAVNVESLIAKRIEKETKKLIKQRMENREKEMIEVMYHGLSGRELDSLKMEDLKDLCSVIDQNISAMDMRCEFLTNSAGSSSSVAMVPVNSAYPTPPPLPPSGLPPSVSTNDELMVMNETALQMAQVPQQPQSFMDLMTGPLTKEQMEFPNAEPMLMVLEYGLLVVLFCFSSFES
ncbi:hypothetical protein ACFE04_026944 [Oxalis oulophora]